MFSVRSLSNPKRRKILEEDRGKPSSQYLKNFQPLTLFTRTGNCLVSNMLTVNKTLPRLIN